MDLSVSDVETWLQWQAKQLGTPACWTELNAILGIRDPWKLARKIRASFYIPEVRMRTLLEPEYTVPHTLRSHDRNAFLPDELSYQDVWQQLAPLTITYARSLQYWEKQSLLRSQNLRPLAESVIELQEAVKEYVTFNHQDIVRGLGATRIESPRHEPIFSHVLSSPSEEQEVRRATTYAASPIAKKRYGQVYCPTSQNREGEPLSVIPHSLCSKA